MRKLLALLFFAIFACASVFAAGILNVYFLDVGQGDAILVDCGDWEALLDAGPGTRDADDELLSVLSEHVDDGILELAILSHPHADHCGGFIGVFDRYEIWSFWRSHDVIPDTRGPTYLAFCDALAATGCVPKLLSQGDRAVFGQLEWVVLSPQTLKTSPKDDNDNDNSLVLLLRYGDVSFLFTGDIGFAAEATILTLGVLEPIEVLKVAHHGSKYSTGPEFLAAAQPAVAIYSAGVGNRYGHPAAETISRLEASRAVVYGTDHCRTILVSSDGTGYLVSSSCGTHETRDAVELPAPAASGLLINEVEMNPPGSDSGAEWIEIFNPTTEAVALAGWSASYTGYGEDGILSPL